MERSTLIGFGNDENLETIEINEVGADTSRVRRGKAANNGNLKALWDATTRGRKRPAVTAAIGW